MLRYSNSDPRFAYGRHILLVFGTFYGFSQLAEAQCKVVEVWENHVIIVDKEGNRSLLLKSGGGFYLMGHNWKEIS